MKVVDKQQQMRGFITHQNKRVRDRSPQQSSSQQHSEVGLNQSTNSNSIPLRSNVKRPSNTKSCKKVKIQEPINQNVKEMMVHIQQFFIKRIIKYQQEGFDALVIPYKRSIDVESQIRNNHQLSVQRQVLQQWANNQVESQLTPQRTPTTKNKIQEATSLNVQDQLFLDQKLSQYYKERMRKYIFQTWKKENTEKKYDIIFKSSVIKDNLHKFIHDMNQAVKLAKVNTNQDEDLKRAISLFKNQILKSTNVEASSSKQKKIRSILQNSSFQTPNRQKTAAKQTRDLNKTMSSLSKESTQSLQVKPIKRVNRILFSDNELNKIQKNSSQVLTVSSNRQDKASQRQVPGRAHNEKSVERGEQIIPNQKVNCCAVFDLICTSEPIIYVSSEPILHTPLIKESGLMLFNKLNQISSRDTSQFFINSQRIMDREDLQINLMRENFKRKIFFNWVQILPALKEDKFQTNSKVQKLLKALKHPFFKLLKQVRRKSETLKAIDRISKFLNTKEKNLQKK